MFICQSSPYDDPSLMPLSCVPVTVKVPFAVRAAHRTLGFHSGSAAPSGVYTQYDEAPWRVAMILPSGRLMKFQTNTCVFTVVPPPGAPTCVKALATGSYS